jgi:cytoskeletal protein RodZ
MSGHSNGKEMPAQHAEERFVPLPEEYTQNKRTFGQKVKRHCGKYWWVHVIITIIITLVSTLCLVYVGFPHIAQNGVNDSKIHITSMSITNPTPSQFQLELTSVLETHSIFHPQLGAFNASLYLEDSNTAFAVVEIPATPANNGSVSHINQTVQITNEDAYAAYAKTVLQANSYTITLKGRGSLVEGSFPTTHVNYNKKITMKGFNGLAGFTVTSFNILTTTLPDGTNANGTVLLPNPTVMTLEMGNVTLALSVDGTPIGVSTIPNLVLHPGINTVPMLAKTNQSAVIGIIIEPKYKKTGILPVDIVGKSSTYNGKDLPYYDEALQSNKLTTQLNVGKALDEAGLGSILNGTSSS